MKKLNHKNALPATVSMLMTLTVCSSVSQASDIDIYSNATGGKTTITMMLDTSGSMGNGLLYYSTLSGFFNGDHVTDSLQDDYGVCVNANSTRYESNSDIRTEVKTVTLSDNMTVNSLYTTKIDNSLK